RRSSASDLDVPQDGRTRCGLRASTRYSRLGARKALPSRIAKVREQSRTDRGQNSARVVHSIPTSTCSSAPTNATPVNFIGDGSGCSGSDPKDLAMPGAAGLSRASRSSRNRVHASVYDVIVLGLGGMGSAAAYHVTKRGGRVLGLEQFGIAHAQGSSNARTRMIRKAYFQD